MKFACWNVRTLLDNTASGRPARRTALLAVELARYDIDIAALSETRMEEGGSLEETDLGYTFFWKGLPAENRRIHGVGFAVKTSLLRCFPEQPVGISERLMSWRIPLAKSRYATIFSVYAPTLVSAEAEKDCFYDCLSSQLGRVAPSDKIVVLGDFNARVGASRDLWGGVLGPHGSGSCNGNGLRLLALCSEYGLCVTNSLFQLRDMYKTTWMHPRSKHWHILDYILVRQRDRRDVHITRAMRGAEFSTDHRLLVSKMSLVVRPPVRRRAGVPKLCVNKLQDLGIRNAYQQKIAESRGTYNLGDLHADHGPDVAWSRMCRLLIDDASEHLGTQSRKHRDWFNENNEEVRNLIARKNKAHDVYLSRPTAQNWSSFSLLRRDVQRELRVVENEWWLRYSEEMQGFFDTGDTHNFYNSLKIAFGPTDKSLAPVRSLDGDLIKDKSGILGRWAEHFRDLLNCVHPTDPAFLDGVPQLETMQQLDVRPTFDEVERAIASLKCRKAAGLDGLQGELLKYGGTPVAEQLTELIQACWDAGNAPSMWRDAKIITIYKRKGDKSVCGNSRGISLLSTGGKVYARVLLMRLIEHVAEKVLPESQSGFRRDRSTTDMTFVLRLLQEKCREQRMDLYTAFVDLSKAFDTVNRDLLWRVLAKFGCPNTFVRAVMSLHNEMKASVAAAGETSDSFSVLAGVKQGCVLAPVLFNLFVAAAVRVAHSNLDMDGDGVQLNFRYDGGGLFNLRRLRAKSLCHRTEVDELQYADDAAFVSHTEDGLQRVVDSVQDAYRRSGLKMNTDKTEVLTQTSGNQPSHSVPNIRVGDVNLTNVSKFTYLGSVLTSDCSLDDEVSRRIGLASSTFGRLSHKVFANHKLSLGTKKAVYQAVCLSVLLFGCEAWALYRHQFRKLESFHGTCIQKILGLKWYDRVPRTESRRKLGIETVEELILKRQLRWAGHVIRMPENRLPRQVLYSELVTGARPPGGQRKRYKDNLKRTLKQFHIDPATFEAEASNRGGWRQKIVVGAAAFAADYDLAAAQRRERRQNPTTTGAYICNHCGRGCATLAGLLSHTRGHQRRGEAVVFETEGHP